MLRIERRAAMAGTSERDCGSCSMCCKNTVIAELDKPFGRWCRHCEIGKGCGIYQERPDTCRKFACFWLQIDSLPDELRPDRCGAILCPRPHPLYGRSIVAIVEAGRFDQVRKPKLRAFLMSVQRDGYRVFVSDHRSLRQMQADGTLVETKPF
jgi:uncharacterized protein